MSNRTSFVYQITCTDKIKPRYLMLFKSSTVCTTYEPTCTCSYINLVNDILHHISLYYIGYNIQLVCRKTAYLIETSCPTGSRLVEGCRRGLCPGKPSGTHSLAYTLLAPANTPTMNRGMPTHSIAMYSGDRLGVSGGLVGVSGASSTEENKQD